MFLNATLELATMAYQTVGNETAGIQFELLRTYPLVRGDGGKLFPVPSVVKSVNHRQPDPLLENAE